MVIVDASTFVKTRIDHFDVGHRWTMNLIQIGTDERNICPQMKSYMMLQQCMQCYPRCSLFDSLVSEQPILIHTNYKLAEVCTHKLPLNTFII